MTSCSQPARQLSCLPMCRNRNLYRLLLWTCVASARSHGATLLRRRGCIPGLSRWARSVIRWLRRPPRRWPSWRCRPPGMLDPSRAPEPPNKSTLTAGHGQHRLLENSGVCRACGIKSAPAKARLRRGSWPSSAQSRHATCCSLPNGFHFGTQCSCLVEPGAGASAAATFSARGSGACQRVRQLRHPLHRAEPGRRAAGHRWHRARRLRRAARAHHAGSPDQHREHSIPRRVRRAW